MRRRGVVAAARSGGDAARWRAGERRGASGGVSSAIRLRPAAVAAYLFGSRHPLPALTAARWSDGLTVGPGDRDRTARKPFFFLRLAREPFSVLDMGLLMGLCLDSAALQTQ